MRRLRIVSNFSEKVAFIWIVADLRCNSDEECHAMEVLYGIPALDVADHRV
jgi:hypothetical protein